MLQNWTLETQTSRCTYPSEGAKQEVLLQTERRGANAAQVAISPPTRARARMGTGPRPPTPEERVALARFRSARMRSPGDLDAPSTRDPGRVPRPPSDGALGPAAQYPLFRAAPLGLGEYSAPGAGGGLCGGRYGLGQWADPAGAGPAVLGTQWVRTRGRCRR